MSYEKYLAWRGYANRTEYWAVTIFSVGLVVLAFQIDQILRPIGSLFTLTGILLQLFSVAAMYCLIIATSIRRCRDAGISLWTSALILIPGLGVVISIIIGLIPSNNKFYRAPEP